MVTQFQKLARLMLADFDARTQGQCAREPVKLTVAEAYQVQSEIARLREERGEQIIGYKVGCTSKTIQAQLGVTEPIFGRLFASESHPSGIHLSHARFANLAIEGEIAVRLGNDLSGSSTSEEACRDALIEVFPVIELHHYVLPAAWPRAQWMIASGGIHAGFVCAETDVRSLTFAKSLNIRINDVTVGSVDDSTSLVCPIQSLRWLAARLAQFGLQLHKGQVILTGSPLSLFPVKPGDRIVVQAPPLGTSHIVIDP
jgi:2-keto-4-pentenoate hydratase